MEVGNYYLGIDAGTDSVGWAVTDNQYNVIRKKGKSLWGVRLFDGANTAQERRTFRTSRRRNERKKQRISLLQELFYKEICKLDPNFFIRLRDSSLWSEDKEEKQIYSLFNDKNFNDRNYHNNYKTIYHLRADLIKNKEKHDARLVYLAIHHIMKNRGHFLLNGNIESVTSFENTFNEFKNCLLDELEINLECPSISEFENILKDRTFKGTQKCKKLKELCSIPSSDKKLDNIFKLISGLKADLSIIFEDESFKENEHNKISFADSNYEETRELLNSEIQEKTLIIDIFNSIYNWVILSDILSGGEYNGGLYLSIAKVNTYNKHSKDLKILKSVIKKYFPQKYTDIFASNKENNYCSYIGMYKSGGKKYSVKKCSSTSKKCSSMSKKFFDTIKDIINKNTAEEISNDKDVQYILSEIENNSFLPLQINKNNGVIPYQANKIELEAILKNAENYLPFLKEIDTECNKTTSEKIIDLFEFRIPYYVGPLNTSKGENAWMIRKEDGTIRPWNFEQKVDIDKTAAEFITRMTNQCTYLNNETVLPKYSLLYSEYTVLNEINNIRINGEKISVELKQDIFNSLFKNNKQVTCKKLLSHLNSNGYNLKKEDLSGFDGNFKSSLSSYIDLKNYIFGDDIDKPQIYNLAEKIILWITLYGDDSKLLKRVLQKNCSEQLSPEQIKRITKLKFKGWGRLSKVFLSELRGADCETGETMTIIEGLRNTQNNLMQLLSQNYTFTEECEKINSGYFINPNEISYDSIVKDIVASPSIKRSVWQTIQIVEEIQKVMGSKPRKIFVEMARGEEEKVRTTSRKQKLLDLYKNISDECAKGMYDEIYSKDESDFKNIKLYLYYTQMGRCMYSGKHIDLSQLNNTNIWDRDHIYPQSKTKDDSLDNLVLVYKSINAEKSDDIISPTIQNNMRTFWKLLFDRKFISEKKYHRLTRTTPLTDEELAGFINRQLVETRQSTKVMASIFKRIYPNTEIVYVKAKNVSDFRHRKDCENGVKVRELNDYHHAKDAYLNIVVGNVYSSKFTNNPLMWLKNNRNVKYSLNRMYDFNLTVNKENIWVVGKEGTQKTVNKYLGKNDILYTRYAMTDNGEFFDQNPLKATGDKSKHTTLVPLKKDKDVWKYGGYNKVKSAYFMLVESKDKKGNYIRTIETMPIYKEKEFSENEELLLNYCKEVHELKEPKIILKCIKKNALLVVNGFPMHLKGSTGTQLILHGAVQLILDSDTVIYLKKVMKFVNENNINKNKLEVTPYMKLSAEENIKLYDIFIQKLTTGIYSKRPVKPVEKLIDARDIFIKLTVKEQCIVLSEILHLFQCKPLTSANLLSINLKKTVGTLKILKNITAKNVKLVHQSPTGIYEYTVDLNKI